MTYFVDLRRVKRSSLSGHDWRHTCADTSVQRTQSLLNTNFLPDKARTQTSNRGPSRQCVSTNDLSELDDVV